MVTTTTPGGQRVSICMCTRTSRHLATFTRRPGSSLYTLATEPPRVVVSTKVSASGSVAPPCSCRLLSHQTLLWHHCLGHPSLPRLRGMHSRLLVCGLPKSLPPLLPSPAPPCLPCVEGRQRAAPHSSSFPPTTAPLQTLHMDVWGPGRVSGQGRERNFLLVVDDYMRYTTVFPLRSKGKVPGVLIPWVRAVHLQLCERFRADLPVLRLHSDRGVMEVARNSMIYAAAPHFLWPFAVRYATHQLNLWPRVSLLETSPTLHWTGEVGDASVFRVRGSPPPPPLFLAPGPPLVDPLLPQGPAPSGVSQVDPLPGTVPVEVAFGSGAASGGAEPGRAVSEDAGSGGAEPRGVEPGGAEPEGVEPGGGPAGTLPRLSPLPEPLSPQQLREWFAQRTRLRSGAAGAGVCAVGDTGAGDVGVTAGAGGTGGAAAAGPRGDRTRAGGTGAGGAGDGGAGAGDTRIVDAGAEGAGAGGAVSGGTGAGGTVRPRPFFVPLLQQVLGLPSSTALTPPLLCPPPGLSQPPLQPASPLLAPSPYTEQTGGPTERHEPESRQERSQYPSRFAAPLVSHYGTLSC
ncbi:unnamed protein product [Closterium sp. NIES-54]